jgi:NitT/TauT family transport system substrate-binding protein
VPTFVAAALKEKRIRVLARLSDVPALRVQTVRLTVTHARTLEQKKDQLARFFLAYTETMERMYSDPAAMKAYVEWAKVPDFDQSLRDLFYPKDDLRPSRLSGMKEVMDDAVAMKFIQKPLTDAQLKELFGSYQK